jgi:coenzyme F420-0:L-glutamate ligase / coenzyme F420-1:gamma-L-glutamate ligase
MTESPATPDRIGLTSYRWPEITGGHDLAALVAATVELADGDIVVLTSKVLSKAENRYEPGHRAETVSRELARVVARRGPNVIAETRHGLVMAAAGVDASNVEAGSVVTLPVDPDGSARTLRARLYELTGRNVAIVVTDTAGRAWRNGQTDLAIGCAGLLPLVDLAGTLDTFGNVLTVTAPAVGDEIAAAADLVKGKASGRPLAVVRGLEGRVLPPGVSGPGARSLIRSADDDLFGLGTRDAVAAAVLRHDPVALEHFPKRLDSDPEPFEGVGSAIPGVRFSCTREPVRSGAPEAPAWTVQVDVRRPGEPTAWVAAGALLEKVSSLAAANRLRATPLAVDAAQQPGWRTLSRTVWSVA